MGNIDNAFCNLMLKRIHADVKAAGVTDVRKSVDCTHSFGTYTVRIILKDRPDYWYGRAYNAADAKCKAWSQWLRKYAPDTASVDG